MEILIIVVALGAAYFFAKKTAAPTISGVGNSTTPVVLSDGTIAPANTPIVQLSNGQVVTAVSLTPPPPPAPHLKPNAILLSDEEIAQMNLSIGFSSSNKTQFIKEVPAMLLHEQLVDTGTSLAAQCGGSLQYQGTPLALTTLKDGSLALSSTTQVLGAVGVGLGQAAQAIPVVGVAIGAAIHILSAIAAHHAAAVKNEQGLECRLIPSANHALQVIENAVTSGNITPAQGQSALATLLSDFKTQAQNGQSGQLSEYAGHCNAMCWYYHYLGAIVMRKQNRYSQFIN
jgi:hypothetical protein